LNIFKALLGGFHDPAGFDALRANFDALQRTVIHFGADFLQIRQPTSFRLIVGMADAVPIRRTFAANFTTLHNFS